MNESSFEIVMDVLGREIEMLRYRVKTAEEENAELRNRARTLDEENAKLSAMIKRCVEHE